MANKQERAWKRRRRIRIELVRILGACWYCGVSVGVENSTIDHLWPRCNDGGDDLRNLRLACWRCNHRKADQSIEAVAVHRRPHWGVLRISEHRRYAGGSYSQ